MITDPILFRYLAGEASRQEITEVSDWLNQSDVNQLYLKEIEEIFQSKSEIPSESISDNPDWKNILHHTTKEEYTTKVKQYENWSRVLLRIAALLLLVSISGILVYILDGENTVKARMDKPREVYLPDGSQVELAAGSTLTYSRDFLKGERNVSLTGVASFDVKSNPDHPFTVNTKEAKVKVTGTKFMVSAPKHAGEVEVTVRSGKVLFYNSEELTPHSFKVGLGAGEKGIYSTTLNKLDKLNDYQTTTIP